MLLITESTLFTFGKISENQKGITAGVSHSNEGNESELTGGRAAVEHEFEGCGFGRWRCFFFTVHRHQSCRRPPPAQRGRGKVGLRAIDEEG